MAAYPQPTCSMVEREIKGLARYIITYAEKYFGRDFHPDEDAFLMSKADDTFEAVRDGATIPLREALDETIEERVILESKVYDLEQEIARLEKEVIELKDQLKERVSCS